MQAIRGTALIAAVIVWWWAASVFSPWAESSDPRLWLYDTLFYARFALLAWGAVELSLAFRRARRGQARALLAPLVAVGLALLAWTYEQTDLGFRFRVRASEAALAHSAGLPYATPRHRAGHLLIDTVREPCDGEAWLWLGRPFGGGTGTSRALVRARGATPLHPGEGAYAFERVAGTWWLARQLTGGTRPPSHPRSCAPPPPAPSPRRSP